ncbi:hypothetical protein RhiJN_23156 [Ceratobasidium sp. AG-Ba]|nr:hypothetical protein RhiJN_23156 [Ceratobasidium sp. AG-Ba]
MTVLSNPSAASELPPNKIRKDKQYAELSGGHVEFLVKDALFACPKYKMFEFHKIQAILNEQDGQPIVLEGDPVDFRNMFEVLLAPVYGPSSGWTHRFSKAVLVSSLRVATFYDHPTLRGFCIEKLERERFTAMESFSLGRELAIPVWEIDLIEELVVREKPISLEEANLLGLELYTYTVARREQWLIETRQKSLSNPLKRSSQGLEDPADWGSVKRPEKMSSQTQIALGFSAYREPPKKI